MELKETKRAKTQYMMLLAVLIAVVAVFQLFLGQIHIGPVTITFVLLPIVVGAVILGPTAGGILGLVFGAIVLIQGITGQDGFTFLMFQAHPFSTSILCLGKGLAAGLCAGWVCKLLEKKNRTAAAVAAAAAAPVVNTGIFILWGVLMVRDTLSANLATFGWSGDSVLLFLILGCAGINFLVEFALNIILSPVIVRVLQAVRQQGGSRGLDA